MYPHMKKILMALALGSALAGCASGPNRNPADPLEPYNRKMSEFNETVDRAVLKPVATAYQEATPVLVRTGVSNFFANLGDAWSFVNNSLQLRVEPAVTSFFRFAINSTMGLAGVLDVASEMGMDRYKQDFGLTLGRWGVPTGPYFVLPILGPSTIRDTAALPVDMWGNPLSMVDPVSARNSLYALRAVDARANLLRAGRVLDSAALDKYSFTREVYLQVRREESGRFKRPADALPSDGSLPSEPEAGEVR
ncbi:VacJ family lipoprotein [Simplicispira suum]|uniref:ABC transporter n=1 Tax=Simplicispira suum TaxID=2109915 RepID=A0A2S0N0W6_9BURK|nr:MlaA family lipoprotein [Simplicispira suum]AVO41794.1 ABC transporter [Simplicispira suum]MBW7832596.1 VacJ family lipoprotein [Simplicispira suum]